VSAPEGWLPSGAVLAGPTPAPPAAVTDATAVPLLLLEAAPAPLLPAAAAGHVPAGVLLLGGAGLLPAAGLLLGDTMVADTWSSCLWLTMRLMAWMVLPCW
jgi:hypothetical protein